jgi:tRNA threonylcarbamoyladenosine biosynthesis protein TsaB
MLQAASVRPAQLARIVCGAGPGSFTSLRVGAATAKGMAMALGIPLLAASSLALIVAGAGEKLDTGCYLTSLNAMRGDLFVLLVEKRSDGAVSSSGEAELIPARDADARASTLGARLAGSGARPPMDLVPRARGVASLAPHELAPVDLRSWEPDYGRLAEAQVRWEASHGKPLEAR